MQVSNQAPAESESVRNCGVSEMYSVRDVGLRLEGESNTGRVCNVHLKRQIGGNNPRYCRHSLSVPEFFLSAPLGVKRKCEGTRKFLMMFAVLERT